MSWYSPLLFAIVYLWNLFTLWLGAIFITPFTHPEMLWVLGPIYLGWIVTEIFQEKRGTTLGNAISNSVIPLWAGVDWLRTTTGHLAEGYPFPWLELAARYVLGVGVILYACSILYVGARGKDVTRRIGRIRVVSYIVIILTPVMYRATDLSLAYIVAAALFFPIFFYTVETLDWMVPDPQSVAEENRGQPPSPRQANTHSPQGYPPRRY